MINLMKWMSKVSERLKATTVTYKDYSTTTGTSLYQGYYFGNIEGVAISGKSLIGVTVVSAQDNTPAFCAMLTNNIIRAYSTVASKTITIRCIYLGGGNKLPYPFNRIAQILLWRKEVGAVC